MKCKACGLTQIAVLIEVQVFIGYDRIGSIHVCPACVSRWEKQLVKKYDCTQPANWFEIAE